jgi:hypothetical protein
MRRLLLNTRVLIAMIGIGGLLAVALWPRAAIVDLATARVGIGHQTGQEAEIATGLSVGDRVVVHPGDTLKDGARVKSR